MHLQNIFLGVILLYSAKRWWEKTLVNLVNPKQFTKVLLAKCVHLKLGIVNYQEKFTGQNVLDVQNFEIFPSCEAEARSPRSNFASCPLANMPLIVNAKVAKPSLNPPKL